MPDTTGEARARLIVNDRSHGRCELCGSTDALSWAHRRSRAHGGRWAASNGLRLDNTGCHPWTEQHPELAEAGGWRLVKRDDDPATVPVWLATVNGIGWWLPQDDGLMVRVWPEDYGLPEVPVLPPWVRYSNPQAPLVAPQRRVAGP